MENLSKKLANRKQSCAEYFKLCIQFQKTLSAMKKMNSRILDQTYILELNKIPIKLRGDSWDKTQPDEIPELLPKYIAEDYASYAKSIGASVEIIKCNDWIQIMELTNNTVHEEMQAILN